MGTTGQSVTLANSIIGVGILAMPFCFQQCGVLLATLILLTMGLISRLCCYFLLKSAVLSRRRNFEFLAFHVFGSVGKMAVEVGIIGFLMGTCIAYFVVVGDLGPQIIAKMFNINQSSILRTSIMVIVSVVCVLPLGLLRNVDSLSNVSAATICFYFCLVIKVVCEAGSQLAGAGAGAGAWQQRVELWRPQGLLQCVPIFSMALFCQTQLFEIFESPHLSLDKMNLVTKNAINICTAVYFTLGVFGYIAFSEKEISGNILMSLSPTLASDVIKLGFVMSLAFSFPLIIFPCRASLYSFLYKKVHSSHHDHIINHSIPESTFRCITVGIIASALFVSVLLPSIELVLGLLGATIGVLVCLVFPAAAFLNLTFKNTNERILAKGVVILGLVIMVLGTYANLQAAESQIERYDERFITQERIDKIVEDFFEKRGRDDINLNAENNLNEHNKPNGNDIKDSEVQPPNPVPPESNSNELRNPISNIEKLQLDKIKNEKSVNDVLLPERLKEEAADTISDSHPKNLRSKLNGAKIANGNTNDVNKIEEKPKPPPVSDENKDEKLKLIKQQQLIETMKQHGEEQKELMQEQNKIIDEIIKNNKEINVEKSKELPKLEEPQVDQNKHQKLIDTIKQHGEEQKELMKEQKEILDEIKELKQNKDTDSLEAKKLAVESIKQIADMAIKSIGGVTEKPAGQPEEDKKADRLEKLTNEAVQEIAKKAVETIEAIKEIQKPEAVKPIEANNNNNNNNVEKDIHLAKSAVISKVENQHIAKDSVENLVRRDTNQNEGNHKQVNGKRELLSNNAPNDEVKQSKETVKHIISAPVQINKAIENEDKRNVEKAKIASPVAVEKKQTKMEPNKVPITNNVIEKNNPKVIEVKPHLHSLDEPQSYKLGENSLIKNPENNDSKLNQNVPLAVAMSDQVKLENNAASNTKQNNNQNEHSINNDVNGNTNNQVTKLENLVRQKRDVVDCTQTVSLEPADRNLCKALNLLPIDNSMEILPNVNLNDRLSKMPLHLNMHVGSSLNSFAEKKKR